MYRSRAILTSSPRHSTWGAGYVDLIIRHWKIFVRLIFVAVGHRRNIFNDENFPIYGIHFISWNHELNIKTVSRYWYQELFCLVPVKFCTVLRVTYLVIRNETHCVTYLNLGLELLQGHRLQKLKKTTKSLGTAENKPWDKSSISKYDCVYHAKLIPVQLRLTQSDWSSQIWEQTDPMWQKCHPEHQILLYAHRRGLVTRMTRDFYPLSKHPIVL